MTPSRCCSNRPTITSFFHPGPVRDAVREALFKPGAMAWVCAKYHGDETAEYNRISTASHRLPLLRTPCRRRRSTRGGRSWPLARSMDSCRLRRRRRLPTLRRPLTPARISHRPRLRPYGTNANSDFPVTTLSRSGSVWLHRTLRWTTPAGSSFSSNSCRRCPLVSPAPLRSSLPPHS
eukprot:1677041-Prymnesium_polylepis.2